MADAVESLEVAGRHEEAAAAVADDETRERGVVLVDADDQVVELADDFAGLPLDGLIEDRCEEDHGRLQISAAGAGRTGAVSRMASARRHAAGSAGTAGGDSGPSGARPCGSTCPVSARERSTMRSREAGAPVSRTRSVISAEPPEPLQDLQHLGGGLPALRALRAALRPLLEEVGQDPSAKEGDHPVAVDAQLQERSGLDDLARSGEEVEPPELAHEVADAAAVAEQRAQLAGQGVQPHLGRRASGVLSPAWRRGSTRRTQRTTSRAQASAFRPRLDAASKAGSPATSGARRMPTWPE